MTEPSHARYVPCIDCGSSVRYEGEAFVPAALQGRLLPAVRCIRRRRDGSMDPTCCYAVWQRRLSEESSAEHRAYELAVTYLHREGRLPPDDQLEYIRSSAFGSQWDEIARAWKQGKAEQRRGGRAEDVL